jgi:hypothetical protein
MHRRQPYVGARAHAFRSRRQPWSPYRLGSDERQGEAGNQDHLAVYGGVLTTAGGQVFYGTL